MKPAEEAAADGGATGSGAPSADTPAAAPEPPATAEQVFGSRLPLAVRYAAHLADTGVSHGLIGPREVPRLWERHILNCAVLTDLLPEGAAVADIGSGAGLPGITLALRRPDLQVTLVEPLLRRVTWLERVVEDLGLTSVTVRRARAEELAGEVEVPFVTARAVAPLDKLVRWAGSLLLPGGTLLAIKGRTAAEELAAHAPLLQRAGMTGEVLRVGVDVLAEPTLVVRIHAPDRPSRPSVRPAASRPRDTARPEPGRRARRRR